jgi:hypothetical protein
MDTHVPGWCLVGFTPVGAPVLYGAAHLRLSSHAGHRSLNRSKGSGIPWIVNPDFC